MFQRIIDNVKASARETLQQSSLVSVAAISLLVALGFVCAALFVAVLDRYGPIPACLSGAGLFVVISLIAGGVYLSRKRDIERRSEERSRSAAQAFLADPAMVASGIQIVRAIGVKRLLPILAIGGLALGLIAGRNHMKSARRQRSAGGISRFSFRSGDAPSRLELPGDVSQNADRGLASHGRPALAGLDEQPARRITRLLRLRDAHQDRCVRQAVDPDGDGAGPRRGDDRSGFTIGLDGVIDLVVAGCAGHGQPDREIVARGKLHCTKRCQNGNHTQSTFYSVRHRWSSPSGVGHSNVSLGKAVLGRVDHLTVCKKICGPWERQPCFQVFSAAGYSPLPH